ncbi:hypothetical protein HPB49_000364 [Dermacentor silvarum]|uniref:Uncharacterized protein n=1 Tax=Dermacentor silvarum TaxID=543639 RepID=A0ACB8CIP1_DERSI|nr:hypothetical protein HPB49_000364 [Dermacentor silvarum]
MGETNPDCAPTFHLGGQIDQASVAFYQISGYEEPSTDCDIGTELERHSPPEISTMGSRSRAVVQTDLSMDHMKAVSIENCTVSEACAQTETSMQYLEALHQNSQTVSSKLHALKNKKLEFGEEALRDDDGKVSFCTGLPSFSFLAAVYQLVEPAVRRTPQNDVENF